MSKSMMLVTSSWGQRKTFKLIPVNLSSTYNEGIFDPEAKVLAMISKEKKESLHMMAKLNEWGDPTSMKIGKRSNGKDYAEERKSLDTYYEYFVETPEEITEMVKLLAINADSFDFQQYLIEQKVPMKTILST